MGTNGMTITASMITRIKMGIPMRATITIRCQRRKIIIHTAAEVEAVVVEAVGNPARAAAESLAKVAAPNLARVAVPSLARVAVPNPAKVAVPNQAKVAVPNQAKVAVPNQARATTAGGGAAAANRANRTTVEAAVRNPARAVAASPARAAAAIIIIIIMDGIGITGTIGADALVDCEGITMTAGRMESRKTSGEARMYCTWVGLYKERLRLCVRLDRIRPPWEATTSVR